MKERLKKLIKNSSRITVITGAGISAESGVPTFRGENGLWKSYRPEELATPEAFNRNPKIVWEWYNWRRELISKCEPNNGHYFLAELEKKFDNFLLITQNVDGLHRKAGSKKIIEIHGSIWRVKCINCDYNDYNYSIPVEIPPKCPKCNNLIRPYVVWFGESLNYNDLKRAIENCISSDLLIVIGTSGVVQPVASFPFQAKSENKNLKLVDINPIKNPISDIADIYIPEKAGEFFKDFQLS
jgi:NAD-dependent deacetylase